MPFIKVWTISHDIWYQKSTDDKLETFSEEKYFRVLRNVGKRHLEKHFYHSLGDYLKHMGNSIEYSPATFEKFNVGEALEEAIC